MAIPLPKIVVIVGPTASGKTAVGIRIAKKFNGEVISADSRQVFRGMDIGTAKVRDTEGIPHHLIDAVDPDQPFTVVDWKRLAEAAADDIIQRGKLPVVVGGTGLYIQALVDNVIVPEVAPSDNLRKTLAEKSDAELLQMLRRFDPDFAGRADAKNRRRVIRALEVAIMTGEPFTKLRRKGESRYEFLQIGLDLPRRELYAAIDERVRRQIDEGFVDEVRRLLRTYDARLPAFSAIGYREVVRYLDGETTLTQAIERIQFATHAYARRQLTWFRRDLRIHWVASAAEAEKLVTDFFQKNKPSPVRGSI